MRFSAIATDPLDFTRALRIELGLEPELNERDPLIAVAVAGLVGDSMLELMGVAAERQVPLVIMKVSIPFLMHQPADMMVIESFGGSLITRMGLTLWAGHDPRRPLLLARHDGSGNAEMVTPDRLVAFASLPLGIEGSAAPGIARAMQRITDRLLVFGKFRNMVPLAA